MKRLFKLIATTAALALLATGCTPKSIEVTKPAISGIWEESSQVSAASILADLTTSGYCKEPMDSAYYELGDRSVAFDLDELRACYTYVSAEESPAEICLAEITISTDEAAGTDVQRSLSYEDGMSVALFYGKGWEFSLSPNGYHFVSGEQSIEDCAPLVKQIQNTVGGGITRYGDYEYSEPQPTPQPEENVDETYVPPAIETIKAPNLLGALDSVAKNWLFQNGYKLNLWIKSTGFNPKLSCLNSGQNIIIDQSPAPGTPVQNSSATLITVFVDCEW